MHKKPVHTTKPQFSPRTLLFAALTLAAGAPALAADNASQTMALEEVIVSAQRKDESLMDVPIAVQAFSEDAMQNAGVDSIGDLGTIAPSLNMMAQLGAATPYIRGVGSPDATAGQEAVVATYIDGVYVANPYGAVYKMNSIERIEVIKGPQGTLFGRNATGGVIQIVTKDPDFETRARGKVSLANYETAATSLYGTTGLTANVAADLAIVYSNQAEGYGDNLLLDKDINKSRELSLRNKWLVEVSDTTDVRLTADYSKNDTSTGVYNALLPGAVGVDGQAIFAGCVAGLGGNPGAPTPGEFGTCQPIANAGATRAPDDWQDSYSTREGTSHADTFGLSSRIDHSMGEYDLVSITAYREAEVSYDFDQTMTALPLVHVVGNVQSYESVSQEFQLSHTGDTLDWITGMFLYRDDTGFDDPQGLYVTGLFLPGAIKTLASVETTSYAVFGEATYRFTDSTRLTTGLRWTRDERDVEQEQFFDGVQVAAVTANETWSEPTWRLVLDHDLSADMMMYASYSRGFKSGNYNISTIGQPPVNPEILDAYEIGLKSTLLDGLMQMNLAAYQYDYSDLQLVKTVAGSLITVNAAEAEIRGLEGDFMLNVSNALQLRGGFSYIDSEYLNFPDAQIQLPNAAGLGGNDLTVGDVSGNQLARVPELTYNLGAVYTVPTALGDVLLSANYYYNDGFYWEAANRIEQESYSTLNLSVGLTSPDDAWGVRLFADNVTDEEYALFGIEQSVGDHYEPAPPRTYGVEVSFSL